MKTYTCSPTMEQNTWKMENTWENVSSEQETNTEVSTEYNKLLILERMEFLKNQQKLFRQELTKLQNLYEEGKDQNYASVIVIEDKIRNALSVPKEDWFPASHSLEDLIENIHEHLDTLQRLLLSTRIMSDEDVLRNASGGLALEGIYKTRNLEDFLGKREQLIEVPDSFSITGPRQSAIYEQKEFLSQKSKRVHQEVIEKLGLSFSWKAAAQDIGFGSTEEEIKLSQMEEKSAHSYEKTCFFNIKYNYIPLASSFIEKDQLKLSSGAIHALKAIEAAIKDSKALTFQISKFYDRFGSHVNQGPIHFGGIFWWRASSAGFSSDDQLEIKRLTSLALDDFVGAGYNGVPLKLTTRGTASPSQLKTSSTGESNEALMSEVELSVSKTGGPAEVDNHLQWKSHLVTNDRTWSVIDRGTTLIPIWEIVRAAHSDDFEDAFKLSNVLIKAYTEITKLTVEEMCREDEDDNLPMRQFPALSQVLETNEKKKKDQNTSANDTACKKRDGFMNLLQKLGLRGSYPKMMTQANVLVIDTLSLSVNQPSSEEELSSHYLYKLMMLDYRARYMFIKHDANSMDLEDGGETVDSDDLFDFGDKSTLDVSCKQAHIHPMDVQMAVFHCANDFLRQYIFKKLSTCQFAIPFLVPDPCTEEVEFPFWALQHISKSWQIKANSAAARPGMYKTRKMSSTPVPVVSFIRLGVSNSNSKSHILNGVINKQGHSVFFHRHCKGSTPDSLLMNGVVEISWYCPGGKEYDIFDDCVAFLNLHGDAAEHPKQLEFLQAVSTVNVLLLSEHPMGEATKQISQKLSKSPIPLICLFSGKERIQQSKNPTKVRLAAKNRNHAEFTEELILNIKQCIGENKWTASIDKCRQVAVQQQFKVNEDQKTYQEGYEQALTLISLLKEENPSNLKEKLLPLQGELWHEWCRKNKEQYRLHCKEKSIEQQQSEIKARMAAIRQRQLSKATPLNDFLRSFLECLNTPTPNSSEDTKLYMLQWLTILLDDLTTDVLARLEEDYHSIWRKISKDKEKASHVNQMQSKLNSISDKMAATTVGLQHLMREVGQLYETIQTEKASPQNTFARTLPKIGADMLVSGCPLELMDGDAAHVPLTWVEAVIDELVKIFGDKKLFILSILGIQSSGKSTLLNTMFGVQFSVSAGRCIRGAFMQLIPVESSIRNQLGYDFVLIVDTEGLRSPELSTKLSVNHDNELATFIIGIGDITLINIMGENPSEMQDILQICVQAFLRMKQVNIAPSCIFVHQNVADASAGEKAMERRRCLLQKLDHMTTIAAKEENIDGINRFSDVIQFDLETQVFYFKNLLEGDPPMAPPNPSYSQNVQELKTKLLTIKQWKTESKFSSLSEFKSRVADIWQALLQENFVFSFKNTVEIMVYSSLEEKYAAWSWELRKHAMEMHSKLPNQIGSNLIQDVNAGNLTETFDKVYDPLQHEIEKYFKEDKNKDTLITWKANIDKRFRNLRSELIEGVANKCRELISSKKHRLELDQRKTDYTAELTKKSKALATDLKSHRLDDKKVTEEFGKLWGNWTDDVAKAHTPKEAVNVKGVVEATLQKQFENKPNILQKIKGVKENFEFDKKIHVSQSVRQFVTTSLKNVPNQIQQEVIRSVNIYVTAKENNKEDFHENLIYEILKVIEKTIHEIECSTPNFKVTNEFQVDFSIHLCLNYVSRFQRMHETFNTTNHPLTYLKSQRDIYLQAFRNYCKGANYVNIFVDFLCEHIKPGVLTAVNDKTSQRIAEEMKTNNPAFNSNRSNLENHILKHLATKEDFSSFEEYIDFPKRYFKRFIQENVDKFCNDTGKVYTLHQESLEILKSWILKASTAVTKEVESRKGNASMWLDCFCKTVWEHIVIDRNELRAIENEDIEDWQFLKDIMDKSLEEMMKDEKEADVETLKQKLTEYLFQQLQGCWVQCPFCTAICTSTIPNHDSDHSVQFHHCHALAGRYYEHTDNFSINFCTTAVSGDQYFKTSKGELIPYKTYRKAGYPYNTWNISPDSSVQHYWRWFICKFQDQWEKKKGYKFVGYGKIPDEWKTFTKESALEQLK